MSGLTPCRHATEAIITARTCSLNASFKHSKITREGTRGRERRGESESKRGKRQTRERETQKVGDRECACALKKDC